MHRLLAKNSGFTLIELMVTLAVAAIVLTIGIPSFQELVNNNRLTTGTNQLVTALNLARSEAVKRGVQVTVRRKGITTQRWELGWDVFADSNGDGNQDTGDILIRTFDRFPIGYTLKTGSNLADWIAFLPTGLSKGSGGLGNDTFALCNAHGDTANARSITINKTGRAYSKKGVTVACT